MNEKDNKKYLKSGSFVVEELLLYQKKYELEKIKGK